LSRRERQEPAKSDNLNLVVERKQAGKPMIAVVVGAITTIVLVAATILLFAGQTVTAMAGYGLAFLGRLVGACQAR